MIKKTLKMKSGFEDVRAVKKVNEVTDNTKTLKNALERIAELEAELEAVKKITRDKYKNANEVFGLDLGKEVER